MFSHVLLFLSHSVVSNSVWTCGLQHARLTCPSLSPGVCSNSCPLSWWYHPAISSLSPFSPLPSIFTSNSSFPMIQLFASGGQNIGASASASVLPMNIQGWFPLGLTGSCYPRDSQESSPTPQFKSNNSLMLSVFIVQLSHPYMTTGKTIALTIWIFVSKLMSLLFNMLPRFVIVFLPRNKRL